MRQPHPVGHPADVGQVVDRPAAERRQAERVLVLRLAQVGVQPDVEVLGASSAVRRISDVETLNGEHGASAMRVIAVGDAVVVGLHQPLRVGQDLVVVLHDGVRRQPAVLHRQRHRAAGGVEAHAEVARGGHLGGDQVTGAARVHVEVVGRGGAAGQRELGQPDVGADVGRLLVEPGPQRVERDQPVEQPAGQRGGEGPGEVLVQVVVGVDQARA